jgi:Tol biopolymer transport system component
LKRGISTRLSESGDEHYPFWSLDGKRITYRSAGLTSDSYVVPADGSEVPKILLKGDLGAGPQDWSADGRLIFTTVSPEHPYPSLGIYSPTDHKMEQFATRGVEAKLSPSGKWVAYVAGGIVVQAFPGPGAKVQVSNSGAQPRWSRDGRQIFFIQPDRKLMSVSFDSNTGTASTPRVLFQTRIAMVNIASWQYAVAPDGRFLINSLPSNTAAPLTLLTGWDAQLQHR